MELPIISTLSVSQIADHLNQVSEIEDWLKQLRESAIALIQAGNKIDGYALKPKNVSRSFTDIKAVESCLTSFGFKPTEILYEQKLRSPAQLEKALGKNKIIISSLIKSESFGLNLVKEN